MLGFEVQIVNREASCFQLLPVSMFSSLCYFPSRFGGHTLVRAGCLLNQDEIVLNPVLFIMPMVLVPSSLPIVGSKAELVHEGNKKWSDSCSQTPTTAQKLPHAQMSDMFISWLGDGGIGRDSGSKERRRNGSLELCKSKQD